MAITNIMTRCAVGHTAQASLFNTFAAQRFVAGNGSVAKGRKLAGQKLDLLALQSMVDTQTDGSYVIFWNYVRGDAFISIWNCTSISLESHIRNTPICTEHALKLLLT